METSWWKTNFKEMWRPLGGLKYSKCFQGGGGGDHSAGEAGRSHKRGLLQASRYLQVFYPAYYRAAFMLYMSVCTVILENFGGSAKLGKANALLVFRSRERRSRT